MNRYSPLRGKRPLLVYGIAVLGSVAATLLRLAVDPLVGSQAVPFITYFLAVIFVAAGYGFRAATLTILLSVLASAYYFLAPEGSLLVYASTDVAALCLFVAVSFAIAFLGSSRRRALERAGREVELRQEAERLEWEQRKRFETTLASIGDAVISTDEGGRVTFANQVAQSLLRCPEAEMMGKPLDDVFQIINEYSREKVESPVAKVLREDGVVGLGNHTVLIAQDGTEVPIDDSGAPIRGENGAIQGIVLVFRDVTTRRRADEESRLLASIVESSDDAIISKNLSGVITSWNGGAQRIFEYTAQEVIGRPITVIAAPDRLDEMPGILERIKQGERIDHFETVRRAKSGKLVNVSLTVSPVRDAAGRIVGASKVARDITERLSTAQLLATLNSQLQESNASLTRSYEELQKARDSLKATLASIGDAVISTDSEGRIVFANQVAQSLLRCPEAEMLGKHLDEVFRIINEHSREKVESPVTKVLREGAIVELANHTVLIARDGTEVPIDDSGAPIRGESGTIQGTVLVFRDITERRQKENALRESEQRFQNLADGAPVLIWVCGADEKCTWFNRPWLEFTGRTMEQELGDGWAEGIHVDDLQRRRSTYKESFDRREPFSMEYRLRRHDGEWRWILDTGMPLQSHDGTFLGYIGSCIDITERKKAEEERLVLLTRERAARSEAERANRLKDEFLATVSHELRTPLAAVLGWAQLLEDPTLDESTRERAIRTIQHNAKMQSKLLEDILDVSRVVSGKLLLEMQRVELPVVIDSAVESMRPTAEAKGIRIESVIDPQPGAIQGDPERLEQVVRNLLSNAVKFSPEGGRVEVRLEQRDSLAEIRVRDWGEGIAADFLPHVFEPFRQADVSPSRRHGGLGLGLAIVQQVVELHEGAVDAHSDGVGTGTTFTVRIPLVTGGPGRSEEDSESAAEAIDRLSGLRVLLVEDNADTRDMLAVLLQSQGAEVRAAASAQEALASFRLHRPDVLLCDIGLPLEDGYSLIRQIRSLSAEEGGRVPAVALSAYTRFEDRQQTLAAGFQMHLPKPINPLLLTRALADLSRGGGASTEEGDAPQESKRNFRIVVIDDAKDLADIFGIVLREMGHEVHVFYDGLTALSQAGGIQPEIIFSDISMHEMNGYELAKRLREMPGLRDVILVAITGFSQAEGGDHLLRAGFDCHMVKPVLGAQLNEFFSRLPPRPARQ